MVYVVFGVGLYGRVVVTVVEDHGNVLGSGDMLAMVSVLKLALHCMELLSWSVGIGGGDGCRFGFIWLESFECLVGLSDLVFVHVGVEAVVYGLLVSKLIFLDL